MFGRKRIQELEAALLEAADTLMLLQAHGAAQAAYYVAAGRAYSEPRLALEGVDNGYEEHRTDFSGPVREREVQFEPYEGTQHGFTPRENVSRLEEAEEKFDTRPYDPNEEDTQHEGSWVHYAAEPEPPPPPPEDAPRTGNPQPPPAHPPEGFGPVDSSGVTLGSTGPTEPAPEPEPFPPAAPPPDWIAAHLAVTEACREYLAAQTAATRAVLDEALAAVAAHPYEQARLGGS